MGIRSLQSSMVGSTHEWIAPQESKSLVKITFSGKLLMVGASASATLMKNEALEDVIQEAVNVEVGDTVEGDHND